MNKKFNIWGALFGAGVLLTASGFAHAATKTWANPVSGRWDNANNWTPVGAPQNGDDVIINTPGTYTVTYVPANGQTDMNTVNIGGASGKQTLTKASFTLNIANSSTIGANGILTQSSGTIGGGGILTDNGVFNFSGGTLSGTLAGSTLEINSSGSLVLSGTTKVLQRNVNNDGKITWPSGTGSLNIGSGLTVKNNNSFVINTNAPITRVGNVGANPVILNNFSFVKDGGGVTQLGNVDFTNTFIANLNSGTLSVNGVYNQTGGETGLNGGSLSSTSPIGINGGILTGSGNVTGSVNNGGGTVTPSSSNGIGVISISGNYTQGAGGTYKVEVNGPTPAQYDVLNVGGAATLNGALNVSVQYPEMSGESYQVLNYASRSGAFNPVSITGAALDTIYNPTNLTLAVVTLTTNLTTPQNGAFVIAPSTFFGTATRTPASGAAITGVAIQVVRDSDGFYYNGSSFQAAPATFPANFDAATGKFSTNTGPNSSKVIDGQTFTITAIATDANGNTGSGNVVNVRVDNTTPLITSDNAPPQNGTVANLPGALTGTATDPNGPAGTSSGLAYARYTLRRKSDKFYYNGTGFQEAFAQIADNSATTAANSGATVNYSLPLPSNLPDDTYILIIASVDKVNLNSAGASIVRTFTLDSSMTLNTAAMKSAPSAAKAAGGSGGSS